MAALKWASRATCPYAWRLRQCLARPKWCSPSSRTNLMASTSCKWKRRCARPAAPPFTAWPSSRITRYARLFSSVSRRPPTEAKKWAWKAVATKVKIELYYFCIYIYIYVCVCFERTCLTKLLAVFQEKWLIN